MICHTGGGTGKSLLPQNVTPADLIPEKLEMPVSAPRRIYNSGDLNPALVHMQTQLFSSCFGQLVLVTKRK
jgi:hypothetical protein